MKLNVFNNVTLPKALGRTTDIIPRISFNKSGVISINKTGAALLNIGKADKVTLAQDEEDPCNWYLFKDNENGYQVRTKDFDKSGCICFNHNQLRTSLLECFDFDTETSHNFKIARTPEKHGKLLLYGILISAEAK